MALLVDPFAGLLPPAPSAHAATTVSLQRSSLTVTSTNTPFTLTQAFALLNINQTPAPVVCVSHRYLYSLVSVVSTSRRTPCSRRDNFRVFSFRSTSGWLCRCFRPRKVTFLGVKIAVFGARNGRLVRDPGPASQVSVRSGPRGHGKRVRTVRLLGSRGWEDRKLPSSVVHIHTERCYGVKILIFSAIISAVNIFSLSVH